MVRNRRWHYFRFAPDDGGGEGGATPTPTPAAPAAAAAHVEEAATSATQAASATGESGWNAVATELKGLRTEIGKLLTGGTSATPAAPESTPTPAAPDVDVEVPKPPVRKVRRGNRKVERRG